MSNLYSTLQSGYVYEILFNKPFLYTGNVSSPTGIFIGLTSVPPTNISILEIASVGGYVRQPIGTGYAAWSYPYSDSGVAYNNNRIDFPVATAYWGWVSGAFMADNGYSGNKMFYATLSYPKEININDQFYIPISGCTIKVS